MVHLSNIPDPELEDEPAPRTLPELCPPPPPNNPVPLLLPEPKTLPELLIFSLL